jgi:LmbE family N-acetylglucosaminyl deacetylase
MLRYEDNGAHVSILKCERRKFHESRQAILQWLYDLNEEHSPDLVLTPCRADTHQDHETITSEAVRCFKKSSIFGYILRWNCSVIKEDVTIPLEDRHIKSKIAALGQYLSQSSRPYFDPEYHRREAYVRGLGFPSHLAEAFEMIRLVIPSRV